MNIEELDKALRQINGNLISAKECQYLKCVCLLHDEETFFWIMLRLI